MAPHSSTLAWKIPWTEEPGRLQSMGSLGVGHDKATSLSLFTFMHWRRKWQPTPVLLPGESHGRRSLVGYCSWGRKESDTTERLHYLSIRVLTARTAAAGAGSCGTRQPVTALPCTPLLHLVPHKDSQRPPAICISGLLTPSRGNGEGG